eukprot:412266_1
MALLDTSGKFAPNDDNEGKELINDSLHVFLNENQLLCYENILRHQQISLQDIKELDQKDSDDFFAAVGVKNPIHKKKFKNAIGLKQAVIECKKCSGKGTTQKLVKYTYMKNCTGYDHRSGCCVGGCGKQPETGYSLQDVQCDQCKGTGKKI